MGFAFTWSCFFGKFYKEKVNPVNSIVNQSAISSILKQARHSAGLKVEEVAKRLGFSKGLVSGLENGKRKPSLRYLQEFERGFRLPAGTLVELSSKGSTQELLVNTILDPFRKFAPPASVSSRKFRDFSPGTVKKEDLPDQLRALLLRDRLGEPKKITVLWSGQSYAETEFQRILYDECVPRILKKGIEFEHLITPSRALEYHVRDAAIVLSSLLREQALRATGAISKRCIRVKRVSNLAGGMFPADFYLWSNCDALICLSDKSPYHTDIGYAIEKDAEPFYKYLQIIGANAKEEIQIFNSDDPPEFMTFMEEFAQSENSHQHRYLAQRFLGSHTRPPTDFRPTSDWYERVSTRRFQALPQSDVKKIMQVLIRLRSRSHEILLERLAANGEIRHIHSRLALMEWAEAGTRPDIAHSQARAETNEERLDRIEHIIELLSKYKNFQLALVDDLTGKQLGWQQRSGETDLAWAVQGQNNLIIEGIYPKRSPMQTQAILNSRLVADLFSSHFEEVWKSIADSEKQNSATISFFTNLKQIVLRKGKRNKVLAAKSSAVPSPARSS
jgi:transcriptional regulator with XRE-family HTH domain